ncbi:MAG: YtxH domain-containing protein [Gemmatimonadaceae bacterium]
MSLLGLGIVIGVVLGAGVALLTAPQSGEDTRASLTRRVRRASGEPSGIWERLGREMKRAATLKRKERELASARGGADAGKAGT